MTRLTLRLDFPDHPALGPGKIRLLELIGEHGSISAAGRAMGMSYRRAWLLVDELNRTFRQPAVASKAGGVRGGGAELTAWGRELVAAYRRIEAEAVRAAAGPLALLEGELSADGGLPGVEHPL